MIHLFLRIPQKSSARVPVNRKVRRAFTELWHTRALLRLRGCHVRLASISVSRNRPRWTRNLRTHQKAPQPFPLRRIPAAVLLEAAHQAHVGAGRLSPGQEIQGPAIVHLPRRARLHQGRRQTLLAPDPVRIRGLHRPWPAFRPYRPGERGAAMTWAAFTVGVFIGVAAGVVIAGLLASAGN